MHSKVVESPEHKLFLVRIVCYPWAQSVAEGLPSTPGPASNFLIMCSGIHNSYIIVIRVLFFISSGAPLSEMEQEGRRFESA